MTIYFITKAFKARRMTFEEDTNALWLDPNVKERFLRGHQVGFNLNLLRSVEEYPALSRKVNTRGTLVFFTLHLKDLKMAVGVDEAGLDFINQLKVPDPPSIDGNPMIQRKL